ncbi:MAG: Calx-beta domain-containing protein [Woeseia sp.]
MKTTTTRLIPLIAAGIAPVTAVTTSLMSPLAMSAQGDLDPGFGDVGRLGPILNGPAWSLKAQDDGSILLAGGRYAFPSYYYYNFAVASNFVRRVSDTGLIDAGFMAATIADTQVLDIVRQPDGQVVAVGRRIGTAAGTSMLIVFRLQPSGSLDPTFGKAGLFELSSVDYGDLHAGTSIVLDAAGRIVVAGSRDDTSLIVLRLLPNGSLDGSFGTSGVFTGPAARDFSSDSSAGAHTNILRTASGGYRVTASNMAGCHVVALTDAGALDNTFGTSGISKVGTALGPSTFCNSMVAQADGRLLVAGKAAGLGFAARLLANGQPDPGFAANAVSSAMSDATAVAVGQNNSIIVAGVSVSGETIMRLQANGELDALFGNAGSTLIDLASEAPTSAVVHDIHVAADGSVVAAGGDSYSNQAFVVRLLGAGGGDSPGVLGIAARTAVPTAEGNNEVVVNVRRTGGAAGTVSVAYQTIAFGGPGSAVNGQDYSNVSGRLTWADSDTAEQQIQIPIIAGNPVEANESFRVALSDPQGGAGLGAINATIEIAADGGPFGQIAFAETSYRALESESVTVEVTREFYSSGAVSVTLTPISGGATVGADFAADPVILSWADGESGLKSASFAIIDDSQEETNEHFTIELSNPTGGALIGQLSSARVLIPLNDRPPPNSKGGGATGYWSLLLLSAMAFLRRARVPRRLGTSVKCRAAGNPARD